MQKPPLCCMNIIAGLYDVCEWRGKVRYWFVRKVGEEPNSIFYPRHEQSAEGLMQFCQWQHVKL